MGWRLLGGAMAVAVRLFTNLSCAGMVLNIGDKSGPMDGHAPLPHQLGLLLRKNDAGRV